MDLICTTCMEPWDMDFVLHDSPDEFKRIHGNITSCPSCGTGEQDKSDRDKFRSEAIAALSDLMGDDIDGLAATIEDFGLDG